MGGNGLPEVADETYIKKCQSCGKDVEKPILNGGYVFCSEECEKMFMSSKTT